MNSFIAMFLQYILCCLLISSLFFGCKPSQQTASNTLQTAEAQTKSFDIGTAGGQRLIPVASLPNTFNPYMASDQASLMIHTQLFLGLVRINAFKGQMEPALAQTITPDKSHTKWIIQLKPNLKWSDGHALTAEDVAFTYTQIINNPSIPNNYRDFWGDAFPEIKVIDSLKLVFTLKKTFAPFLNTLVAPILPKHIFASKLKLGVDGKLPFHSMWGLGTSLSQIISSGPWAIRDYKTGEQLILKANSFYFEKDAKGQSLPYLNELIFSEAAVADVALIRFQRGESDAYLLRPEDYDLLAPKAQTEGYQIHNLGGSPSQLFVSFNQSTARYPDGKTVVDPIKSSWFRNLAFRQALAKSIDKHAMIQSIYQGRAVPQSSHLSSYNPFYAKDLKDIQFDPQQAHKILFDAGFRQNAQGELYDQQGHRVQFELTTNTSNGQRDAICSLLVRQWGKLVIKVDYRPRPFNLISRQIHETFDWEVLVFGLAGSPIEPHFSASRWHKQGRMHLFNRGSGPQWKGKPTQFEPWESDMENLYNRAAESNSHQKRLDYYHQAQILERQHLPFIYLVSELNLLAVRNELGNARPSVYGGAGMQMLNWATQYQYIRK